MLDLSLANLDPNLPTFYVVLITALIAFFLSSLIAVTYEFTTKSIYKKAHFLQALALIGIVAATVMQAIGDSLAIGLGMLGALSIIRFRTVMDDPRNITFMFASLASGIACGVFGYVIALTGTLIFCIAAIILRFSPLSNATELLCEIRLQVPIADEQQEVIEEKLRRFCQTFVLTQLRFLNPKKSQTFNEMGVPVAEELSRENFQEFTYLVRFLDKVTYSKFIEDLQEIEELEGLRLNFKRQPAKL